MSILFPGELLLSQVDQVQIQQIKGQFSNTWINFGYIRKEWQQKLHFINMQGAQQFLGSLLITNFRLFILAQGSQDILKYVVQDQPVNIQIIYAIPLMHFIKIQKSSEPLTLVFDLYQLGKFIIKFAAKPYIEQTIEYLSKINDGRVHFSKFAISQGVFNQQESDKPVVVEQVVQASADPLATPSTNSTPQVSIAQQYGFKLLTQKHKIQQYIPYKEINFNYFAGLLKLSTFIDIKIDNNQVQQLVSQPLSNPIMQQFKQSVELLLPVNSQQDLNQPLSNILDYQQLVEKIQFNVSGYHLTLKNLHYKLNLTYPSVLCLPHVQTPNYAQLFQLNRFPVVAAKNVLRSGKLLKNQFEIMQNFQQILQQQNKSKLVVFETGESGFQQDDTVTVINSLLNVQQIQQQFNDSQQLIIDNQYQNINLQQILSQSTKQSIQEQFEQLIQEMGNFQQNIIKQDKQKTFIQNNFMQTVNKFILIAERINQISRYDDQALILISGIYERFLAPIILVLVDMLNQTVISVEDFIISFRMHFMQFGFPLQSIYSQSPSKPVIQQHELISNSCLIYLFQIVIEQFLQKYTNHFNFGINFIKEFIADILSFRYPELLFDNEAERVASCVYCIQNCFIQQNKFNRFKSEGEIVKPISAIFDGCSGTGIVAAMPGVL